MSAPLVLLMLIGMAAIVWSACFVGCSLDAAGDVVPFSQYQQAIIDTPGLVACWPLDDTSGTTASVIGPNDFPGTYTKGPVLSTSPGTFTLNQSNIVAGDTIGGDPSMPNPCVLFDGGFVKIPWKAALRPSQFTLEAWVKPNWASSDVQTKAVVASASAAPSPDTGFALYATPNSTNTSLLWAAGLGVGAKEAVAVTGNNQTIVPGSLYFLVMTYDGSTLNLWVNPADTTQPPDGTIAASGYKKVPSPTSFYIGAGRPDLPTPLYPFNGWIQDVAIYNVVLPNSTIEMHYLNGSGMTIM